MKVMVEENLFIESDTHGYMIKQYSGKVDKNGVPIVSRTTYHSTIEQCIRALMELKIKDSPATTLRELLVDVKRIKEYIKSKVEH